jgi:hypothetical protein
VKLPFDFGARFVLRLLLPGAIMAAAFYPLATMLRDRSELRLDDGPLFITVGLLSGLAFLLMDMPIYMTLEGRRFWPRWLRGVGLRAEARRLRKLLDRAEKESDPGLQVELDLQASQFPIDRASGERRAVYPTRLGNLLTSFETYPTVKYGLDGVFYWPRLWVTIEKDLREELDSAQAIVDGAIYACAALVAAAALCLAYAVTPWSDPVDWRWVAAAGGMLVAGRTAYRSAIFRYAQYGELFAAVFDQHRDKLHTGTLVADLDTHMGASPAPARSPREESMAAWRFLRWHRYRPATGVNQVVKDWLR